MFRIQILLSLLISGAMAAASAAEGPAVTTGPGMAQVSSQTPIVEERAAALADNPDNTIVNDLQSMPADSAVTNLACLSSASDYRLVASGHSTGTSGVSQGGTLQVIPVPEPGEWGSLLAGLGLIALKLGRLRRRMY